MARNNDWSEEMKDLLWPKKPHEQLEEAFDAPRTLTDEEKGALEGYLHDDAYSINQTLRKGRKDPPKNEVWAETLTSKTLEPEGFGPLDRAIEKQPAKDWELWRGSSSKEKPGYDPAYKSTTPLKALAEEFARANDEVIFHIKAPNMKAIEIKPSDFEDSPWESPYYETIFGRGTTMTETSRWKDDKGRTIVEVELGYK